jgi:hypothetical protein
MSRTLKAVETRRAVVLVAKRSPRPNSDNGRSSFYTFDRRGWRAVDTRRLRCDLDEVAVWVEAIRDSLRYTAPPAVEVARAHRSLERAQLALDRLRFAVAAHGSWVTMFARHDDEPRRADDLAREEIVRLADAANSFDRRLMVEDPVIRGAAIDAVLNLVVEDMRWQVRRMEVAGWPTADAVESTTYWWSSQLRRALADEAAHLTGENPVEEDLA